MPEAPCRGERKCGTCALYTSKEEDWAAGCKLASCECRLRAEGFGIALCKHYKPQTFIDRSNHDFDGPATGYCEWKCPPILRKVLWSEWRWRLVNKDTSWCHEWTPLKPISTIDQNEVDAISDEDRRLLEHG